MRGRRLSIVIFLLALAGLVGGLAWLIHLRFESGRAYALRSSLRSDPLGSKALHDAYAELPGLQVSRNFVPLVQLRALSPDATLLLLNTSGGQMHRLADFDRVVDFVERGGRLVIAMNPERVAYEYLENEMEEDSEASAKDDEETNEAADEDSDAEEKSTGFTRRSDEENELFWAGLALRHGEHEGGEALRAEAATSDLPERTPWREGGVLVEFDEEVWSPIYQIDEEVVAAQRRLGAGSIVVLTDDYLFSNEALLKHRYAQLLAWVLGGQSSLIFEETHLGVSERSGVATLMRRYGLEGFAVAFASLMALVVWRGASPLLPPYGGRARDQVIRSEHSIEAGLGDLIHRSLPSPAMPKLAFEAWKQSFIRTKGDQRFYAEELDEIEALLRAQDSLPARQRKPVETHLKIKSIINRKKRRRQ
jgi:hypothetical protein